MSAYETCPDCYGSGMHDYGVSIGTCPYCHGDCVIRARDSRGRFVAAGAAPSEPGGEA